VSTPNVYGFEKNELELLIKQQPRQAKIQKKIAISKKREQGSLRNGVVACKLTIEGRSVQSGQYEAPTAADRL